MATRHTCDGARITHEERRSSQSKIAVIAEKTKTLAVVASRGTCPTATFQTESPRTKRTLVQSAMVGVTRYLTAAALDGRFMHASKSKGNGMKEQATFLRWMRLQPNPP
jgi:aminoglycoside phosphotransferase